MVPAIELTERGDLAVARHSERRLQWTGGDAKHSMTSTVVRDIFMTGARGAVVDEKGYHRWVQRAKQGTGGRNAPVGER
jgi:hypothetical protein